MLKKYKGFIIFVLGIVFNLIESLYFGTGTTKGFNLTPMSIGEFICDDIAMAIMILGMFIMATRINESSRR